MEDKGIHVGIVWEIKVHVVMVWSGLYSHCSTSLLYRQVCYVLFVFLHPVATLQ